MKNFKILFILILFFKHGISQEIEGSVIESVDSPFGFHHAKGIESNYENLGIEWIRLNAVWGEIQDSNLIENGEYDWTKLDHKIAQLENANLLITISLLGTPVEQTGSYVPSVYPYNKENYLLFVQEVVSRYKKRASYFQIENEPKPNILDYAELSKISYNTIKSICNDCKVVMAGPAWGNGSIANFNNIIKPIIEELNGNYMDIYDNHFFGNADDYKIDTLVEHIKQVLIDNNFNIPFWITEMGTYSGDPIEIFGIDPPYQSETDQAISLIKRYIYPIAGYNVDKIFWAYGMIEGFQNDDTYFDHTGLIYDGMCANDQGYGVKKLAYYSYKLMTEKLEGSKWDEIETVLESNNIYIYKIENKGNYIWVAWNDNENDTTISTSIFGTNNPLKVTSSVPSDTSGLYLSDTDYPYFFETDTVAGQITLKKLPLFIEEVKSTLIPPIKTTDHIIIYPNPSVDWIKIKNIEKENIESINIINSAGQLIKSASVPLISISELPDGYYTIIIQTDLNNYIKKMVKLN